MQPDPGRRFMIDVVNAFINDEQYNCAVLRLLAVTVCSSVIADTLQ